MSLDTLTQTIGNIRDRLGRGEYRDEAKVSQGIVMRVLQDLGWPVFDTGVVAREYSIGGRRVDYALIGKFGKPAVLLEVKRVGRIEIGEGQLFEYAFHGGAPIVVLTDGRNWWLYYTFGEGNHRDRRFAEVDLQDGDPNRNADLLLRYLWRESVLDGQARRRAEADYDALRNQCVAEGALPAVWRRLTEDADGPLVRLVGSEVEKECGVSPSGEMVTHFLRARGRLVPETPPVPPITVSEPRTNVAPQVARDRFWFRLHGEIRHCRSGAEVIVGVFTTLAKRDPTFLDRFAAGQSARPWISKDCQRFTGGAGGHHELTDGWWIDTHRPNPSKIPAIQRACEVAGIVYGQDLAVSLPSRRKRYAF